MKTQDTSNQSSNENFLEFNGKRIATLRQDGEWWVAVKPICEALEIQFNHQHQRILNDPILGELSRKHKIVAADSKERNMVCLPEKYVYGWLFGINSDSQELLNYKRQCYEVLFEHFHGALTGRVKLLEERLDINQKIRDKQALLEKSSLYTEIEELKKERTLKVRELNRMDKEMASGQTRMNFN